MKRSSRRDFLASAAGTSAVTFWIPKKVHGYSRAHVTDTKSTKGVSKWDLDTPALVLDLDKLEQNIAAMRTSLAATKVGVRPHAKTHKSADIAKTATGGRRRRYLHREADRGGDALRRGHPENLHDDRESEQGEDSAGDESAEEESRIHPGGRLPAERARSVGRREGGRRHG